MIEVCRKKLRKLLVFEVNFECCKKLHFKFELKPQIEHKMKKKSHSINTYIQLIANNSYNYFVYWLVISLSIELIGSGKWWGENLKI